MTLDETIKHCEDMAVEKEVQADFHDVFSRGANMTQITECQECAKDYRQLAEWLEELKYYRERNTEEYVYSFAPGTAACPTCGQIFSEGDASWKEKYCFHCGQRLQWLTVEKMGGEPIEQKG